MLVGIVLRGSAFMFRSYGSDTMRRSSAGARVRDREHRHARAARHVRGRHRDGRVGAIAVVRRPVRRRSSSWPWLTCSAFGVGLIDARALLLSRGRVSHRRDGGTALQNDFRTRALWAAGRGVRDRVRRARALVACGADGARGLMAGRGAAAPHRHRHRGGHRDRRALDAPLPARARGRRRAGDVHLWGWAAAQYPYLLPPTLTIEAAAAPSRTLVLVLWALAAGACVLLPVAVLSVPDLQDAAWELNGRAIRLVDRDRGAGVLPAQSLESRARLIGVLLEEWVAECSTCRRRRHSHRARVSCRRASRRSALARIPRACRASN